MRMKKSFTTKIKKSVLSFLITLLLPVMLFAQQYTTNNPPPATPPGNVTNTQDRDQMMFQLGLTFPTNLPSKDKDPNRPTDAYAPNGINNDWTDSLGTGNTITRTDWGLWNNYHDNKVGTYTPLYLLKAHDGTPITTSDQWTNIRRPEILQDVQQELWGVIPADSILPKIKWSVSSPITGVLNGSPYIQKTITGYIDTSRYPSVRNVPRISATLRIPANATGKVPIIIEIWGSSSIDSYYTNCSANGWGVCIFDNEKLQPDNGAGLTSYLIGLVNKGNWRKPSDWGAIGAWAWGIKKLVDYFQTDPNVDATHIGVSGHSRYGKTTIASMAFDPRIFIAYPSCAGSLGYKIIRRQWGQNLENSGWDQEYHWMSGNMFNYCGPLNAGQYLPRKVENLKIDGYFLLSLCAPRPVFGNSGNSGDTWQDYQGAYMSMLMASPVWNLFGKKGLITNDPKPILDSAYLQGDLAFRWHHEGHTDAPDWPAFWRFAAKYYKAAYIVTSTTSFNVADTAKNASFTISSDTTWSITGPSWITINPASGKYNKTVSLQFQRNVTNVNRIDTIKISAPGIFQKMVVTQKAQVLSISPTSLSVTDTTMKSKFTVTCDTTWNVTGPSWVTLDPINGKNNGTVSLQFQRNQTNADRIDTIKITATGLTVLKMVLTQKAQTLSISPTSLSVTDTTTKSKFTVTSDTTWSITTPSWVTANPTSGNYGGTVSLQFQRNQTNATRIDTIKIMPAGLKIVKMVVTQAMQTLSVSPSTMILADTANSKGTFTLISDTTWTVGFASGSPWLTANPASGKFNNTVTLTAAANNTGVVRTDTVKINAPGVTTKKILVNQGFTGPIFTATNDSTNISTSAASKDTVRITSNTIWTITSSQSWVTLNQSGGTNNAKVGLAIAANSAPGSRTDTIKVTAPGATPQVFTLTQAGAPNPSVLWLNLSSFSFISSLSIPSAAYTNSNIWPGSSATAYSLRSSAPWLTIPSGANGTPANFGGTYYLMPTIAAIANSSFASRTANLIVSFPGSTYTATFPVTQAGKTLNFSLSKTAMVLGSDAGSNDKSIITCDTTWTATNSQSWLSLNHASGNKNDTIIATISSAGTSIRIDTIKVTAVSTTLTKYIVVASGTPTLSVSDTVWNFSSDSASHTITVTSNAGWTATCPQSFVNLSTPSGFGNGTIVVSIGQNPFTPGRTAKITISCMGLTKVITINQATITPTLNVSALSLNFKATVDSSSMWINTNGDFTISSNVDWITSSPRTNVGIGIAGDIGMVFAKIKANANTSNAIRTAIVTVSVPGTLPQTFTYTQDASTGTNDLNGTTNGEVTAYPNPVSDVLYVKLTGSSTISLFNMEGQLISTKDEKGDLSEINMSGYKSGIYILKIVTEGRIITKKVFKQ
jgi:hypothetical protein